MSSPGNKGQACLLPSLWRSFLSSVFLEGGTTHCVQSICLVSLPRGLHGTWGARGAGAHIQFMLPILLWVIDDLNPSGLLVSLPTKCVWLLRVDLTAAGCCLGTAWQHHLLLHPLHSPHFPALCWAWLLGTTPPAPQPFLPLASWLGMTNGRCWRSWETERSGHLFLLLFLCLCDCGFHCKSLFHRCSSCPHFPSDPRKKEVCHSWALLHPLPDPSSLLRSL